MKKWDWRKKRHWKKFGHKCSKKSRCSPKIGCGICKMGIRPTVRARQAWKKALNDILSGNLEAWWF